MRCQFGSRREQNCGVRSRAIFVPGFPGKRRGELPLHHGARGRERGDVGGPSDDHHQLVGQWIDSYLDHKMILHQDDPIIPELMRLGEPFVVVAENPTAENIAKLIYDRAVSHGLPVVEVTLAVPCANRRPISALRSVACK